MSYVVREIIRAGDMVGGNMSDGECLEGKCSAVAGDDAPVAVGAADGDAGWWIDADADRLQRVAFDTPAS